MAANTAPDARSDLLAELLDETADALLALDGNGTIVHANAAAATLLGRAPLGLRGTSFTLLVHRDDRRAFLGLLLSLGPQKPSRSVEIRLVADEPGAEPRTVNVRQLRAGGAAFAVRVDRATAPAPDEQTSDEGVALEVERVLLRLPQAVIGVDADERVVFANGRARRLVRDRPLRRGRRVPDESSGLPLGRLARRLLSKPGPLPPEVLELPDGRSLRVTGTGAHAGFPAVLVFDDISQHVARTTAERAFVQNAAHQLRTPLAGIANAVELLQAGAKDDPVARDRFLAHLERETQRLSRLARALLVLARARANVQPPRLGFIELEPVLRRIVERLEPRGGVRVGISCPPRLTAFAEPDLLEEALTALAENAAQHTHRGAITLRCVERADSTVDIEVEDSGDGIAPEHQALVFDSFFRGTTGDEGFGLGLSIAAQAVAALGSTLAVDSAPQRGSTFSFRLPAAAVATA